jgi:hypothetical protein
MYFIDEDIKNQINRILEWRKAFRVIRLK